MGLEDKHLYLHIEWNMSELIYDIDRRPTNKSQRTKQMLQRAYVKIKRHNKIIDEERHRKQLDRNRSRVQQKRATQN